MGHRLIRLRGASAFENLAMEEVLFTHLPRSAHALLFYTHPASIVIGRTQNPFHEASVPHAIRSQTPILRRRSGGGTVVHDLGNLNVCFMGPEQLHHPPSNLDIMISGVQQALLRNREAGRVEDQRLCLKGGDRGEITLGGHKITGSAYRISGGAAYHHATVLVDSDLDELGRCLRSDMRLSGKLAVSGAPSVRSSVTNVADVETDVFGNTNGRRRIAVEDVIHEIASAWCRAKGVHGQVNMEEMGIEDVERENGGDTCAQEVRSLRSSDWVYGQTPRFSSSFDLNVDDKQVGKPSWNRDVGSWDSLRMDRKEKVVLFMRKGAEIDCVRLLAGGAALNVQPGYALGREKGMEMGPESFRCKVLTELLRGTKFSGTELKEKAMRIDSKWARRVVQSIAEDTPDLQFVAA